MFDKEFFRRDLHNFFVRKEMKGLRSEYRSDNTWVQKWRKWDDETIMDRYIDAAHNLYLATARNKLKLTVLGDTEIRSMPMLLKNFGLMSANGLQETEDKRMVKDLEQHRKQVGMGTKKGIKGVPKVLGVGSILSDKMWTPILNDALMLGSIEGNQDFYVALNNKEQTAWDVGGSNEKVNVRNIAKKFGSSASKKKDQNQAKWLSLFIRRPQMIWDGNNPRVFARELLALKYFGYKPVYSAMGLAFSPNYFAKIGRPTFTTYTNQLRADGFFDNDKEKVMGLISEFLFEDRNAL